MNKDRTDIAMLIAEELLESDALDLNNFRHDVDSLLSFVQGIILSHLKDYISVNLTEPFILLACSRENSVSVETNCIQENRLILKKKRSREKFDTVIMNVLLDEINNCLVKDYGNGLFEFKFEVRDFRYSLHVTV